MKKQDKEWTEEFLPKLPEEPPIEVEEDERIYDELGAKLILFNRESVNIDPDDYGILFSSQHVGSTKRWGARCTCTECSEDFIAGYGCKSIYLCMGEDGCTYDGYAEYGFDDVVEYKDGEEVVCPNCGEVCTLAQRSSLHSGRIMRTQIAGLQNIDGIAVITYWMAERTLYQYGYTGISYLPREAVTIAPSGNLIRFAHTFHYMGSNKDIGKWKTVTTVKEPAEIKWTSGGGYSFTFGSWYAKETQSMDGTTGEKTGIEDYWGLMNPAEYLMLWKKFPAVENLVRTGAAGIVEDAIRAGNVRKVPITAFHTDERKPNEILGISKEDYRIAVSYDWNLEKLNNYKDYRKIFPKENAEQFQNYIEDMGLEDIKMLRPDWELGIGKIIRYLTKQSERDGEERYRAWMFRDYQKMLHEIHIYADLGEPTREEVFPPHLRQAHDRLTEQQNLMLREKKLEELKQRDGKFLQIKERMHPLEWTDGTYVIVIPEKPADLVREGNTLHHCVGGYSKQHVSGSPIFFVRHYRRPERSWYTLNEDLTGEKPHRIQLHGYKNEIVGRKHLRIPKQVETFVQTWEREVLAPWYRNNKKEIAI